MKNRVTTNRKSTQGRQIYYQHVNRYIKNKKGEILETIPIGKTIKHIHERLNKLKIGEKLIEQMFYKNRPTKCSEKTTKRKEERSREVLLWNSSVRGPFLGSLRESFKF